MKHDLRSERILLCEPERWEARCKVADDFELKASLPDEDDPDDECADAPLDMWGDPIPQARISGGLAIIPIRGIISQGYPSVFERIGFVDLERVRKDLMSAATDPRVGGVLLDVRSPGGGLRGVPETAALVALVAQMKDVWAFTDAQICSAAYYVVAASKGILATSSADIGALGVFANIPTDKGFWTQAGYKWEMIKSGKFKGAADTGQDLSPEQRDELQRRVDASGAAFRMHVAAYRPTISLDDMEGQSFNAAEAVQRGFIDDVPASFDDVAASLSGLYSDAI